MKKKAVIEIPKDKVLIKNENLSFATLPDGTYLGLNRRTGRKLKSEGQIVQEKRSMVSAFGVTLAGDPFVMIETTADELLKFARAAKKAEAYFKRLDKKRGALKSGYLKHLNPEVTFSFTINNPKKKSNSR